MCLTSATKAGVTEFRRLAFQEIMNIHKIIPKFSRSSQFLAFSILDKYEEFYGRNHNSKSPRPQQARTLALACLLVASKFNGTDETMLDRYLEMVPLDSEREQLQEGVLEAEGRVFKTIEFEVPFQTPLTHLEFAIEHDDGYQPSRNLLIKCMKTLLLSLEMGNELSQTPMIGREIYQLLKSGQGTFRAATLYQKVCKTQARLKRQHF